jgi:hypothetical protein
MHHARCELTVRLIASCGIRHQMVVIKKLHQNILGLHFFRTFLVWHFYFLDGVSLDWHSALLCVPSYGPCMQVGRKLTGLGQLNYIWRHFLYEYYNTCLYLHRDLLRHFAAVRSRLVGGIPPQFH